MVSCDELLKESAEIRNVRMAAYVSENALALYSSDNNVM